MNNGATAAPAAPVWLDPASIVICTLAWGTTWFAITLQFGAVDPIVSIVYRFALAAALLFAWCAMRGETVRLTLEQHLFTLGAGAFTFGVNYPLVYWAEERVTSAVVAIVFAAMAFVNQMAFRIVFRVRAPALAWVAALLGVAGVGLISWEEVIGAEIGGRAWAGIGLAFAAVIGASVGNLFSNKAQQVGAGTAALTGWAMAYGTALLTIFALVTGRAWTFDPSWRYVLSLLHLSLVGSVIAFALFFGLAKRRGYAIASYISALTPLVAMLVSSVFESKHWGWTAFGGAGLVLSGQFLLMRAQRGR